MRGKEIIRLDAEVVSVIASMAFRARLSNGHEFTAYVPRENGGAVADVHLGGRVRVELSPYDMSRGEIIWNGK